MDSFFNDVVHRWPVGREDYHWHILPDIDVARTLLYEPYRELTHRGGLAPVPPDWFHVTLVHSGPVNEFKVDEIEQVIDRVRDQCAGIPAFELTLDRPHVGRVAVECPGHPGAPARRLWDLIGQVTRDATADRFPVTPAVYYPHCSIAYSLTTFDHREMKAWLSDCDASAVTFPVSKISLVAQSHDMKHITWRHITDVPLVG